MSNKKQSSIEWVEQQFQTIIEKGNVEIENLIWQQAKAMHKQEVIDSYAFGDNDGYRYMTNEKQEFEHAEQYYNETFGGGEDA